MIWGALEGGEEGNSNPVLKICISSSKNYISDTHLCLFTVLPLRKVQNSAPYGRHPLTDDGWWSFSKFSYQGKRTVDLMVKLEGSKGRQCTYRAWGDCPLKALSHL